MSGSPHCLDVHVWLMGSGCFASRGALAHGCMCRPGGRKGQGANTFDTMPITMSSVTHDASADSTCVLFPASCCQAV